MPIPDKTRYSYVYHPSRPHKERWEKAAAKAHTSLSKLIIAAVDGLLDENEEFQPRREMVRELESLRSENKSLRNDLSQKTIVLDRYEAELKRYRAQPFQEEDYRGMRRYSKELVEVLKTRGQADSYKILEALGIDPRESELVKAVSRQLEELEAYGMIKTEGRSWQWIV
jgi:uncharacterized caspase-like protein